MSLVDSDHIWDRLTEQLKPRYKDEEARALARNILIDRGHMTEDNELTLKGRERSMMGAYGRAMDRRTKKFKKKKLDKFYLYDPNSNEIKTKDSL